MVEELREKDRLVEYLKTGGQRGGGVAGQAVTGSARGWPGRWRWASGSPAATTSWSCWARAAWAWSTARSTARSARRSRSRRCGRSSAGSTPPCWSGSSRSAARPQDHPPERGADLRPRRGGRGLLHHDGAGARDHGGELIREAGRLDVPATLTIGKQVCRALEVAHEEGVIHRDVKPQNLLVDPSGFLKVMDFGIARLAEHRSDPGQALTAAGVVVGTPQYMAPEQLFGEPVDGRADLYATGAVLFECVTGRPVFEAPSLVALLARHLEDAAPNPRTSTPTCRIHSRW